MPELFTRTEVDFGGAMHAQSGIITPANGLTGVLMQNIQLSYQQQVTRLYELGTAGKRSKVYYVGGRAQGTMSVAHVIGPGVSIGLFYSTFGDVCAAGTNTCEIDLSPNICGNGGTGSNNFFGDLVNNAVAAASGGPRAKYKMKYCVLISIGMSVSAQDFVVNENSQLMFSGLEYLGT